MKIFIQGDGKPFSRSDLLSFLSSGGWHGTLFDGLNQRGQVDSCKILRVMDMNGRWEEYHGLVEVHPELVGMRMIEQLDGQCLNGGAVEVRQWFERNHRRERRSVAIMAPYAKDQDQRENIDRRRSVWVQLLHDLPHPESGAYPGKSRLV